MISSKDRAARRSYTSHMRDDVKDDEKERRIRWAQASPREEEVVPRKEMTERETKKRGECQTAWRR